MADVVLTEALEILRSTLEGREAREPGLNQRVEELQETLRAAIEERDELCLSCSGLRRAIKTLEAEVKRAR